MKHVYYSSGIVWTGPGRSTYMEHGPYTTAEGADGATRFCQGNMRTQSVRVPPWFYDLVAEADSAGRRYLYWEGHRAGYTPDSRKIPGDRFRP